VAAAAGPFATFFTGASTYKFCWRTAGVRGLLKLITVAGGGDEDKVPAARAAAADGSESDIESSDGGSGKSGRAGAD
jgi:hypothetical protein